MKIHSWVYWSSSCLFVCVRARSVWIYTIFVWQHFIWSQKCELWISGCINTITQLSMVIQRYQSDVRYFVWNETSNIGPMPFLLSCLKISPEWHLGSIFLSYKFKAVKANSIFGVEEYIDKPDKPMFHIMSLDSLTMCRLMGIYRNHQYKPKTKSQVYDGHSCTNKYRPREHTSAGPSVRNEKEFVKQSTP